MTIEIVSSDCNREQAVKQIFLAISRLSATAEEIFSRVSERLCRFNDNLGTIIDDVKRIEKKIEAVQQVDKAVVVYSRGRFPEHEYVPSSAVYNDLNSVSSENSCSESGGIDVQYSNNRPALDLKSITELKKSFFHFDGSTKSVVRTSKRTLSGRVTSVSDLFLFNTSLNVYTTDDFADPLDSCDYSFLFRCDSKDVISLKGHPTAGDTTLRVDREELDDPLLYKPELGTLQDFDFPDVLPQLSGIVSDFSSVDSRSFPSVRTSENLSNVYSHVDVAPEKCVNESPHDVDRINQSRSSTTAPTGSEARNLKSDTSQDSVTPVHARLIPQLSSVPLAPPPPPPLLPSLSSPAQSISTREHALASGDHGRTNLMEEIRNSGGLKGARLRSAKRNVISTNGVLDAPTEHRTGESLMSSLAKALESRRKVIAGAEHSKSRIGAAVLERISSLIPPPPLDETDMDERNSDDDSDWS